MGLLLQIVGVICVIVSLVQSLLTLKSGRYNPMSLVLLFVGMALVRAGRKMS